jgi:hypothetical protein
VRPEDRAARERKQKIFVVVGGVLLLGLLAIQVPKLLGGSGSSEAAATTTTSTTPGIVAPAVATPGAAQASEVRTAPRTAKLSSFGAFKVKDPFVQQVVPALAAAADAAAPAGAAPKGKTTADAKKPPEKATKFSLGQKAAKAPALTVVSVNGERQAIQPGGTFPSADPVFVLVAEHPDSKSIEIGVVGGAYSSGSKTTKLKVGKPLTLVNTATGARYRIVLVAAGSGSVEKPAATK